MKFERLRKNHKKEIVIGALAICVIGGALTFATTKAKYKLTESIDLVKGTINYKPYDFKIMAMYKSDDGTNYTEITDRMPSEGYIINESKSYCTLDNKNKDTNVVLKTINGEHIIRNLQKTDKCYLYFDKIKITSSSDIIAKSKINIGSPNFSETATTDEGIYQASDGMYGGTSYYYRGAVTNNYVKFAEKCWRIIRINGDGSIRLIYDGTTCHANGESTTDSLAVTKSTYNLDYDNISENVGWTYTIGSQRTLDGTASNAKTQTETWFSSNITETNLSKVVEGKYCNERNTASGYAWETQPSSTLYYAGYERLNTNKTPTLSCSNGDTYKLRVGLITADEIAYAGGVYKTSNSSYFLYNGYTYWTMSPFYVWSGSLSSSSYMFCVHSGGSLNSDYVNLINSAPGIRPVINLRSDITFASGGTGTQTNPYVVE